MRALSEKPPTPPITGRGGITLREKPYFYRRGVPQQKKNLLVGGEFIEDKRI